MTLPSIPTYNTRCWTKTAEPTIPVPTNFLRMLSARGSVNMNPRATTINPFSMSSKILDHKGEEDSSDDSDTNVNSSSILFIFSKVSMVPSQKILYPVKALRGYNGTTDFWIYSSYGLPPFFVYF